MISSPINHPPKHRLAMARDWQLEACDGDLCAAMLLNMFEQGHIYKSFNQKQSRFANDVAERHGDRRSQQETLLQWYTEAELERNLLKGFEKKKISRAINEILVPKGFIQITNNPNDRYKFDKTRYFIFNVDAVNNWISKNYKPNHTDIDNSNYPQSQLQSTSVQLSSPSVQLHSGDSSQTPESISSYERDFAPMITPKNTTENTPIKNGVSHDTPNLFAINELSITEDSNSNSPPIKSKSSVKSKTAIKQELGSQIQEVFDHWRIGHEYNDAKLIPGSKRWLNIQHRLEEGYTVNDLKLASYGCKFSPHHMGANDRNTKYDDIELICRNPENVDKFKALGQANINNKEKPKYLAKPRNLHEETQDTISQYMAHAEAVRRERANGNGNATGQQ